MASIAQYTKVDTEFTVAGITYTQRVWRTEDGTFYLGNLYRGGWKCGMYRTESGLNRAVRIVKYGQNLGGMR